MMLYVKSFIFYIVLIVSLLIISLIFPFCMFIDKKVRQKYILSWVIFFRWWIKACCGVQIVFTGNLKPSYEKTIYFSNHQGFIETLVLYERFIPTSTVLKNILLTWPVIGWALLLLSSIPINRGKGNEAVKKIFEIAPRLLDDGFSIIYYPEGTRKKPGELGYFYKTGAELAHNTESVIIPIVHNAGEAWYGGEFLIRPANIVFYIGDPLRPENSPEETTQEIKRWTEKKYKELFLN